MINARDLAFLELAVETAAQARSKGNHPFGAVLVDAAGNVLQTGENTVLVEKDCTGHAELNLVRTASQAYSSDFLWGCTLYASTEPCAMCASAIYWANIGRVVFALSGSRLYELVQNPEKNPRLSLSCWEVFARGVKPIEVEGPVVVSQMEAVHAGFWE